MPNGLFGAPTWLAEKFRDIDRRLDLLATQSVLSMASADGVNGYMKISDNAVNSQPAIEFHYTGGGGDLLAQIYETTGGAIQITGGLTVSGTKNFVQNHPTKPGWTLRHAATESPVNGIEYWGQSAVPAAATSVVVTLPPYFAGLAKARNTAVLVTPVMTGPGTPPPVGATAVTVTGGVASFTVYAAAGTQFSWLVKAERQGTSTDWGIEFPVETYGKVPGPKAPTPSAIPDTSPRMTS